MHSRGVGLFSTEAETATVRDEKRVVNGMPIGLCGLGFCIARDLERVSISALLCLCKARTSPATM